MPLNLINIKPGFNKQITDTAAEGQYVDGDNVRFRYGLPEKIGGFEQLVGKTLPGVARAQHQWTDLDGRAYAAIGTHKGLFIYYGDTNNDGITGINPENNKEDERVELFEGRRCVVH